MSNSVSAPAAPIPSTGVPGAVGGRAPAANVQPASVSASNPTTFSAQPAPVTGGGFIDDLKMNATARLTAFAHTMMQGSQQKMTALVNSEGGAANVPQLQLINQEMSQYQLIVEMAAKIQEKEERAAQVWVQR